MVEPWLRGTLTEIDAVRRQVLHALELTGEDAARWCGELSDDEINARPFALPSVAFHLRHMARSLDRLLSYAEARALDAEQLGALAEEHAPGACRAQVMDELARALARAGERVLAFAPGDFEQTRWVGRDRLPTTLGGLLVHCAEHTQRHAGQAVTTAKLVRALRG